jgi:hypothetical protein
MICGLQVAASCLLRGYYMVDWLLQLNTAVYHHERVSCTLSTAQEKNSKLKVWFILTACHLNTTTNLKNQKLSHPKLGLSMIV